MRLFFFILIAVLPFFSLRGENEIPDSLTLKEYDDLSWEYLSIDFEKSCQYAKRGILAAREAGDKDMEATLTRNLGVAYYMNNKMDSAVVILQNAMELSPDQNTNLKAAILAAIANIYNVQNKYDLSIEYYQKAIYLYEIEGRTDKICPITANIGTLYYNRHHYEKAEKYLLEALSLAIKIKDKYTQAQASQNLSNLYFNISNGEKAYIYANEAVNLYRECEDEYNLTLSLTSLSGACHLYLNDNTQAMKYAKEALAKAQSTNLPYLLSSALCNMAYCYYRDKDYSKAAKYALEGISYTDPSELFPLIAINMTLAESYSYLGKPEKAEAAFHTVYDLMNAQSNIKLDEALAEKEIQYQTMKKEDTIKVLSKEKRLLWVTTAVLLFSIFFLIMLIILRRRYSIQKQLRAEERMIALEKEKQLLSAESLLNGENQERIRISRELHDGLGGILTMTKMEMCKSDQSSPMISLLDKAINEMRRISSNLMPEILGRYGLIPTIGEYCKSSAIINYHSYGEDIRYDLSIEMNFYRIACELINNALKHSMASTINVQIITEKNRISLTVQDNGKGFDTSSTASGNGLSNIKNRVSLMGASIDIFSSEKSGTEITIELNIKEKND